MINIFKKLPIFISHKRDNGQSSPDAILIRDVIKSKKRFDPFLDVYEASLGRFSSTLEENIKTCKVFILVLPKNQSLEYLCDESNWVHKEIKLALNAKATIDKNIKIIPVSIDKNIKFPPKEELGEIAQIVDYDILYYDTNNEHAPKKLYKAIGYSAISYYINMRSICTLLAFIILTICIYTQITKKDPLYITVAQYEKDLKILTELYTPISSATNDNVYYSLIVEIDNVSKEIFTFFNKVINFKNNIETKGLDKDFSTTKALYVKKFEEILKLNEDKTELYGRILYIENKISEILTQNPTYSKNLNPPSLEILQNKLGTSQNFNSLLSSSLTTIRKNKHNNNAILKSLDKILKSDEFNLELDADRASLVTLFSSLNNTKKELLEIQNTNKE